MTKDEKVHYLQQLKKHLISAVKYEEAPYEGLLHSNKNLFGVFCKDNSFLFAKQKAFFSPISLTEYHLVDYFSGNKLTSTGYSSFKDGDEVEGNKIVSISKVIPAISMEKMPNRKLRIIQDEINLFLVDNPSFVSYVFDEEEKSK